MALCTGPNEDASGKDTQQALDEIFDLCEKERDSGRLTKLEHKIIRKNLRIKRKCELAANELRRLKRKGKLEDRVSEFLELAEANYGDE